MFSKLGNSLFSVADRTSEATGYWLTTALSALPFQHGVNRGIRTHLVVALLGPVLQREFLGIDLRNAAGAHQDFLENVVADRHQAAVQPEGLAAPQRRQVKLARLKGNLLLQTGKCRLADANSVQIVFENEVIRTVGRFGIVECLKGIHVERTLQACNGLAHPLAA